MFTRLKAVSHRVFDPEMWSRKPGLKKNGATNFHSPLCSDQVTDESPASIAANKDASQHNSDINTCE